MLKRTPILCVFLLFNLSANAQDSLFKPSTHVGVHGGMNFSRVSFSPYMKQSFVLSEAYGLVFRHVSEPNIGLQLEVNLSGSGWKELIDSVGSYTRRLKSINVPVLAAFVAGSRSFRFAFTVGPYVSYHREEKETINIADPAFYRAHYETPLTTDWEFGFTGGGAFEIHTKAGAFVIRASYTHSLSNLFPLNHEYYFMRSRSMVIHAGMMYFYSF